MSKGCAHFCTILFSRFLGRYAPTNFSHFIRKMNKLLCMFDQSSALQTLQSSIFHTRSLNSTIAASMAGGAELWGQKSFKFDIDNLNSRPLRVSWWNFHPFNVCDNASTQIIKLQGVFSLLVSPLKSLKCQLVSVSIHLLCMPGQSCAMQSSIFLSQIAYCLSLPSALIQANHNHWVHQHGLSKSV